MLSQAHGIFGSFQAPEKVQLCKVLKYCVSLRIAVTFLILLVMGVGFFPLRKGEKAKAPNLGAQTLVNAKSKGNSLCLCFAEVMDAGLMGTGLMGTGLMGSGLMDAGLMGSGLMDAGLMDTGLMGTGLMGASLLLQPPHVSDVVISMVTQTPRLWTAACEEQHSSAQGSHDQVSQKESPNKSSPLGCHSCPVRFFPW